MDAHHPRGEKKEYGFFYLKKETPKEEKKSKLLDTVGPRDMDPATETIKA